MKKLITFLLIMAILLPALTVSATQQDPATQTEISSRLNETRYKASQLQYEIRDLNNTLLKQGSLDSLVSSTDDYIFDYWTNGSVVEVPSFCSVTIYPKNSNGFVLNNKQLALVYAQFTNSTDSGILWLNYKDGNYEGTAFSKQITGSAGELFESNYGNGVGFKVKVMNFSNKTNFLGRLNFVSYY